MGVPDDELAAWMALARIGGEGRGGRWWRLARRFGGARGLLLAGADPLREAGLNEAGVAAVRGFCEWDDLGRTRQRCAACGMTLVAIDDARYPPLLREIDDPPLLLYCRGRLPAAATPAVAVVGSRRASRYGLRVAAQLGRELAGLGIVVVSGLASGIDAAVHRGAIETGAGVAVLAGGLDRVTPRSNRALARRLARSGALVSEHPPATPPLPGRFPVRNRIITGIARATVVVEAAERSGSLVSARHAAEQGREVLAVPGNLDSPTSRGTNRLIRDGCAPLVDLSDLLAACGLSDLVAARVVGPVRRQERAKLGGDAALVVRYLGAEPASLDALIEACRLDPARVLELLTQLELEGVVERAGGGTFALKDEVRLG